MFFLEEVDEPNFDLRLGVLNQENRPASLKIMFQRKDIQVFHSLCNHFLVLCEIEGILIVPFRICAKLLVGLSESECFLTVSFLSQMGSILGQGSFATVHKARIIATGQAVAVKVVRPERELNFGTGPNGSTPEVSYQDVLEAMKLEVKIAEILGKHPYVVDFIGTTDGGKVFIMEKAASDLYSTVKQHERNLPLHLMAQWSEQMLEATRFMHDRGVVHQDIKSSNILIFPDMTAKMCDFGLARQGANVMCVDRELATLWYRAPELLMGESVYTPKVDEWGVGCILLEMMMGSSPFRGKPECVCSCPQITHRNYNSDQLMKIFAMLGTPVESEFLARMSCQAHFSKWPLFQRKLERTVSIFSISCLFKAVRLSPVTELVLAFFQVRECISMERARQWVTNGARSDEELQLLVDDWINLIAGMLDMDPEKRTDSGAAVQLVQLMGSARPRGPKSPKSPVPGITSVRSNRFTTTSGSPEGRPGDKTGDKPRLFAWMNSGERAAIENAHTSAAAKRSISRRSSFSDNASAFTTHTASHSRQRRSSELYAAGMQASMAMRILSRTCEAPNSSSNRWT